MNLFMINNRASPGCLYKILQRTRKTIKGERQNTSRHSPQDAKIAKKNITYKEALLYLSLLEINNGK